MTFLYEISRCPECGETLRGEEDLIPGTALVQEYDTDLFEYDGETVVDWNGQSNVSQNRPGYVTVSCPKFHVWETRKAEHPETFMCERPEPPLIEIYYSEDGTLIIHIDTPEGEEDTHGPLLRLYLNDGILYENPPFHLTPDAYEKWISAAKADRKGDKIRFDSDALVDTTPEGAWVQGWVWVPKEES